ncbi:MAG TPA: hypothetical protein VK459_19295 [Polyangiaceae bacterium]|jgi:hypothetical protein|nr:hypothetical protein [Polyangiaceae bacterium]
MMPEIWREYRTLGSVGDVVVVVLGSAGFFEILRRKEAADVVEEAACSRPTQLEWLPLCNDSRRR